MHADVIVVGQRSEAFLAAYLFARRGFRTLLLGPSEAPAVTGRMLLETDLAARLKPVEPALQAVIAHNLTVEFWSPDDRGNAIVRQLPFLLIDEADFCRTLETAGLRTRNFKCLRGIVPASIVVTKGEVTGVRMDSGDVINSRLVVEADILGDGQRTELKGLWPQHDLSSYRGRLFGQRRQVGTAASAWALGSLSLRVKPGQHMQWHYRVQPDELEVGAFMLPACKLKPEPLVGRVFREAGLEETTLLGESALLPHLAPPLPAPIAPGYLAVGQVAGHANPWLPMDRTAALGGALQAWLAGADALDEGKPTVSAMWEYVRAMAMDAGARQAYAAVLSVGLRELDAEVLELLFKRRLVDTYFLSCLIRSRMLEEDFLDTLSRSVRAMASPGAMVSWHRLLRRARKLARLYRSVPLRFQRSEALNWQEKILKSW